MIFDNIADYSQPSIEVESFFLGYFSAEEIQNKKVLDLGCRNGDYASSLLSLGASEIHGVDISEKNINYAKKRNINNAHFYVADIKDLSIFSDSYFDIAICSGTLPYLGSHEEMCNAFNEIKRVVRNEGVMLLLFQRDNFIIQVASSLVKWLPVKIYERVVLASSFIVKPFVEMVAGRKLNSSYTAYLLLSIRGLTLGVPTCIADRFDSCLIKTPDTMQASEKTTISYKIICDKKDN